METLANIFLVIALSALGISVWALICNERTRNQRLEILRQCSADARRKIDKNDENWRQLYDLLDRVSYEQHLFALMTFRNPRNLYVSH